MLLQNVVQNYCVYFSERKVLRFVLSLIKLKSYSHMVIAIQKRTMYNATSPCTNDTKDQETGSANFFHKAHQLVSDT